MEKLFILVGMIIICMCIYLFNITNGIYYLWRVIVDLSHLKFKESTYLKKKKSHILFMLNVNLMCVSITISTI